MAGYTAPGQVPAASTLVLGPAHEEDSWRQETTAASKHSSASSQASPRPVSTGSTTLLASASPSSSIRRPRYLLPGKAARLAGSAVTFIGDPDPASPQTAPIHSVYLHMSTQPITRGFVYRVLFCQGLPLVLVSLQTWLYLWAPHIIAKATADAILGTAFVTFVLGIQTLCFHHVLHPWLMLLGFCVLVAWLYCVSLLRHYGVWPISHAVESVMEFSSYAVFSCAAFIYPHYILKRGADVVEAVPGAENTPLLCWGFAMHRLAVSLTLGFSLGPLLWVWYTFYIILLEVTQDVLWKQLLVMLVKLAADVLIEAIYVRISRLVPILFYYYMFYFHAVKCSFHLLGLRSLSNVVSLVLSEAALLIPPLLRCLLLVPSVAKWVGNRRVLPDTSKEHVCCDLGTVLLAQFIVCFLVIPSTVLHLIIPNSEVVIGRQMGAHTFFMLGAACIRMLCTCAGAHAVVMWRTGLSVLGAVQDMILCEPMFILGTLLFASCQAVVAQWSARVFLPLLTSLFGQA